MIARLRGLLPLLLVLGIPFLLRPREDLSDDSSDAVVVVTPHNEAIRYEFSRAFAEHMQKNHGRRVHIDWRTPGGASEIARYLASQYAGSFEAFWKREVHRPWTAAIASSFANPSIKPDDPGPDDRDEKLARRTFLGSNVSSDLDILFGGGSSEFMGHAAAGRLVDSGLARVHPELVSAIPASAGGVPYWDKEGRWFGACLAGFGICYNRDSLARLKVDVPTSWSDLAEPPYFATVALADPSKSGSAVKAFEMVIQQQMNVRAAELLAEGATATLVNERAPAEGWTRAMRLLRRIGANARYFTDSASKIPLDVAMGDAAAGMCIDFYGRFQSETIAPGAPASTRSGARLGFITPHGGTAMDTDPIGLLRGAPHRELALELMQFVMSPEGQKLWSFKVGAPGGPRRYALRRLAILPELYAPEYDGFRSDPEEQPYEQARAFTYHAAWTGPLFRSIAFLVRVMCVDTQDELGEAYRALRDKGFPPAATALFDDVELIDYRAAAGPVREALASTSSIDEVVLQNRLVAALRNQYRRVTELARGATP